MKTLVIEDDVKTAGALENGLRGGGFLPAVAKSGEEGLSLASTEDFDVIVLDWLLPGRDGLEVLKTLRSRGCRTPVPLLTARPGSPAASRWPYSTGWRASKLLTSTSVGTSIAAKLPAHGKAYRRKARRYGHFCTPPGARLGDQAGANTPTRNKQSSFFKGPFF